MKSSNARSRNQVYSVGNYLMTGKVLGKGHFARVEEATHRIIGKKVAIKIIDLTCIKEEYARRNLHREPRVMAKLRHPCIAALYETMMHGPRLYVVMEAAGGGDLCTHVLAQAARGSARGLPEARARSLAAQLVSAVRHMHSRGVVHRDLKMENIMLDSSKQYIKIVDFGLSNVWSAGAALRTPCGSLEYAAPELFVDGRRYGPEVDLWSIGVIVYGMVTGGLPFTGGDSGDGKSRPQLRAAIARGFTRKQRAALACVSAECKTFIQQLLDPDVDQRMKIEEAARHRWIKKPGMRMKTHPLGAVDPKANREIFKQIAELSGRSVIDVVAEVKADPFGAIAGIYNIKTHLHQTQVPGDLLWSANMMEPRPASPPEYQARDHSVALPISKPIVRRSTSPPKTAIKPKLEPPKTINRIPTVSPKPVKIQEQAVRRPPTLSRPTSASYEKKPVTSYDNGDCGFDSRLPSITEHSSIDLSEQKNARRFTRSSARPPDDERRAPARRADFYRRAGDGLPSWRATGPVVPPPRILLQNNATTIKRASLGNIVSPHSSSNSHCKSERAMPVGWFTSRAKDTTPHLQRLRRTAPMK
ncbi:serine/threonine-protein kinase MARK2-like [Plodia interpunctella]|uniref:serine/threonine-protein kinase MARK2-like n=1 Tax=Plodia interpunctella TaxID=58824 RepID=UPI0023676CF7|nr:serine/threonine-protein kinase MARK2-like [Plodia interpunctella]